MIFLKIDFNAFLNLHFSSLIEKLPCLFINLYYSYQLSKSTIISFVSKFQLYTLNMNTVHEYFWMDLQLDKTKIRPEMYLNTCSLQFVF